MNVAIAVILGSGKLSDEEIEKIIDLALKYGDMYVDDDHKEEFHRYFIKNNSKETLEGLRLDEAGAIG
jgi:hypothetical protein